METKATAHYFDGIKYISISELNSEQMSMFSGWVTTSSFLDSRKIGSVDAVKYEDYEYWFHNHYLAEKDWDQLL